MLSHYRVLDLTDHRGELAAAILGDLGADVIKVEPPGGNAGRFQGPLIDDPELPEAERSLQFAAYNRNKRSIVLDPSSETDRGMLMAMAVGADFVIDSGPPGYLAAYDITFDKLRGINPRIVHVHLSPYGVDGPAAERPASDLTLSAMDGPVSEVSHSGGTLATSADRKGDSVSAMYTAGGGTPMCGDCVERLRGEAVVLDGS